MKSRVDYRSIVTVSSEFSSENDYGNPFTATKKSLYPIEIGLLLWFVTTDALYMG